MEIQNPERRPSDPSGPGGGGTAPVAGLELRSPIILAAGTAGVFDEMTGVTDLSRVGAIVTKSITREPRVGNPAWRVHPLPVGMLNAIGLANPGIDAFVDRLAGTTPDLSCPVVGSAAGNTIEDYAEVCRGFDRVEGVAGIELNVSCPNVHGGTDFGLDTAALGELVRACGQATNKPLIVKLSPVVQGAPSIVDLATAAIEAGARTLTVANTVPAMAIDVDRAEPVLANVTGGLSGPAVHPITLRLVHLVYRGVAHDAGIPIIALGGVTGWRDAAAYVLAGASAIGVGTTLLADPNSAGRIAAGLDRWRRRRGASAITDLVGTVRLPEG